MFCSSSAKTIIADGLDTYSDIYRYDIDDGKFVLHQRLATEAAVDVQYFCYVKGFDKESFLIVSNELNSGNQ